MTSQPKTIVISGGTDGMGRATALDRLGRGDTVIVLGSSEAKGRALAGEAGRIGAEGRLRFLRADLSSMAEIDRVVADIARRHPVVDALVLCANRQSPRRRETADGLEYTFALYYLSRYLLSRRLRPQLDAGPAPVVISVAGVGTTAGEIHWDDLQLERRYGMVRAQLQAGRANDLLGVAFAEQAAGRARYVMYHPGFTRSGDVSHLNPVLRATVRLLARLAARPVETSVRPIVELIDRPPRAALTAIDRGKPVDPSLKTLDRGDADRLARLTEELIARHAPRTPSRGRPEPG
jgi:NAD(P)-dependent dehydrogenase (short-subunit alcohol dehydrogenase family)